MYHAVKFPSEDAFIKREWCQDPVKLLYCKFVLGKVCKWAETLRLIWLPVIKKAVDTWSIIARRLGVVKDIRIMIAKRLWKQGYEWIIRKNWEHFYCFATLNEKNH